MAARMRGRRQQPFTEPTLMKRSLKFHCICARGGGFPLLFATKTPGQEKKSYQEQAEMRARSSSHSSVFSAHKGKAAYYFSQE